MAAPRSRPPRCRNPTTSFKPMTWFTVGRVICRCRPRSTGRRSSILAWLWTDVAVAAGCRTRKARVTRAARRRPLRICWAPVVTPLCRHRVQHPRSSCPVCSLLAAPASKACFGRDKSTLASTLKASAFFFFLISLLFLHVTSKREYARFTHRFSQKSFFIFMSSRTHFYLHSHILKKGKQFCELTCLPLSFFFSLFVFSYPFPHSSQPPFFFFFLCKLVKS